MAQHTDVLDLGRIGLTSGEGRSLDLKVRLGELKFAGETYVAAGDVPVRLDIARMLGGYTFRLRYSASLAGPCMRCLEDADRTFAIDAREVDQPGAEDDELTSPYMDGDELDLQSWARDALVLEMPAQIVCREDCKGICGICGENLNHAGPEHHHEKPPSSRWAKLSEISFE
jgi:DUF177 domain-containing protein